MSANRTCVQALLMGASLAGLLAGCAAVPRPAALDEAAAAIASPEVQELQVYRPALLAEATEALAKAEAAYAAGEEEHARQYAEIALNKIRAAENFSERDGAVAMTEALRERYESLAGREAREREDVERLRALDQRVATLQTQLREKAESDAAVRAARKAMLDAQAKRAEAVGAGAAQYARAEYEEGVALLESAVSALEMSLLEESVTASVSARARFESSIARAMTEAAAAKQPPADAGAKADADAAILGAQAARAGAIGAGAAEGNPARFGEGESLLATAERRFEQAQYGSAKDLAEKATRAYQAASKPAVSAGDVATAGRLGAEVEAAGRRPKRPSADGGADTGRALRSIQIAEDVRADALARGLSESDVDMAHAGYLLESARRAIVDGDAFRAEEKAREATGVLRAALSGRFASAAAGQERSGAKESALRAKADAALATARGQRLAETLKPGGSECPELKAVDALLVKGEKDFQSGDHGSALESGVRAVERLAACTAAPKPRAQNAAGATPSLPSASPEAGDPKTTARVALDEARIAVAVAKAKEAPRAVEAEALLQTAEAWFARGEHGVAETLAKRALSALDDKGAAQPAKPGPTEPAAVTREAARVAIVKAQRRRAERSAAAVATLQRADRLLESAQGWFDKAAYADAKAFADDALAVLDGKEPAQAKPAAAKPAAAKPAQATPPVAAGSTAPGARGVVAEPDDGSVERRSAEDAIDEATTAKRLVEADLPPTMQAAFARGESLLRAARSALDEERYDEARSSARAATAVFETLRAVPRAANPVDRPAQAGAATPAEPANATAEKRDPPRDLERLAEQRIVTFEAVPGAAAPEGWQDAYRKVIRALKLRDSALGRVSTPEQRAGFARGAELLAKSQEAWQARQIRSAAGYADRAASEFTSLGASEGGADQSAAQAEPKLPIGKAPVEAAVREAEAVLAVCNREGCAERSAKEFDEGKVRLEVARKALGSGALAEAREAAEGARKSFVSALEKPRKDRPAPKDSPDTKRQRDDASDQLREADVQRKLCEKADCATKNLEAWLRAESNVGAARAAFSDGDFVRAKLKAKEAVDGLKQVLDALKQAPPAVEAPKGLVVPPGVSGVTVDADRLSVTPAFDFQSGSSILTPASQPSAQQLARVLIENQAKVTTVRVVGYTDSRGNPAINKALSQRRAQAVVDALVKAGVPRALLRAEGLGADSPIADNETPEGRSLNRRVEIQAVMR